MAALIGLGFVEDAERVLSGEGGRESTTNLVQSLRAWVGVNQTAFPSLTSFDEDDRASAARLLVRLLEATEATEATEGEAPAGVECDHGGRGRGARGRGGGGGGAGRRG